MNDIGENPFNDVGPLLDPERKAKVFEIAKHLKKSCYHLSVQWQDDEWLVVCSSKIYDVVYQSANTIDTFSAKDHADLFRMAFADALKEQDIVRSKKTFIMPAGNA